MDASPAPSPTMEVTLGDLDMLPNATTGSAAAAAAGYTSKTKIYDPTAKYNKRTHDIFLSHAWSMDSEGRNNHKRVRKLADALTKRGARVWIDEDQLTGDVAEVMLL